MARRLFQTISNRVANNLVEGNSILSCRRGNCIIPFQTQCLPSPYASGGYHVSHRNMCSYPISRYPVPDKKDLPDDIVKQMEEVEEKSGFLPNVFRALSHRPAEYHAFFAYYDALMYKETGNLSKADREMIVVATSAHNHCIYCVIAHGALMRVYSKNRITADQVAVNWTCADLDARQKAILEFAMRVCKSEEIHEEHFVDLEKHGLDREDAWDIGAIAALFALSNRMAHLTNMRPNDEFYTFGRIPREKKDK